MSTTMHSHGRKARLALATGFMTACLCVAWNPPALCAQAGLYPTSAPAKGNDAKSLAPLLQQGQDALAAGEYKTARDAFLDALQIDRNNATALYGSAVANMRLGDFVHAKDAMERVMLATPAPDRTMVVNMAALQCQIKNPMRAVKFTKDYLTSHTAVLDEQVADALGIALNQADDGARKQEMWKSAVAFYMAYAAKMEAAKPGFKRWGVEWLPADEVDRRLKAYDDATAKLNEVAPQMDRANAEMIKARQAYDGVMDFAARGHATRDAVNQARFALERATADYNSLKHDYDAANAVPGQNFPKEVTLMTIDDLKVPPVGASAVALAPATEPAPDPNANKPVRRPRRPKPPTQPSDPNTPGPDVTAEKPKPPADPDTQKPATPDTPVTPPVKPATPTVVASATPVMKPVRLQTYAVAFPVSSDLAVTAAAALDDAKEISLVLGDGSAAKAEVVRKDDSGLALLRVPNAHFSPIMLANDFSGGVVSCCSFPTVNIFNPTAEIIPGSTPVPTDDGWKIKLATHPRISGAPLLVKGQIVGVEMATRDCDKGEIPAIDLAKLKKFLGDDFEKTARPAPDPTGTVYQITASREVMRPVQ